MYLVFPVVLTCMVVYIIVVLWAMWAPNRDGDVADLTVENPTPNLELPQIFIAPNIIQVLHSTCDNFTAKGELVSPSRCYAQLSAEDPKRFPSHLPEAFLPAIDDAFYQLYRELLENVFQLMDIINATFWMTAGTSLGSIRHAGFVPWDDDVDFGILVTDIIPLVGILASYDQEYYEEQGQTFQEVLSRKLSNFSASDFYLFGLEWWHLNKNRFSEAESGRIKELQKKLEITPGKFYSTWWTAKIYLRGRPQDQGLPWSYPFIDLFAYFPDFVSKYLISMVKNYRLALPFDGRLTHFSRRPFDLYSLLAPKRALQISFPSHDKVLENCVADGFNRKEETHKRVEYLKCEKLNGTYPFMKRKKIISVPLDKIPSSIARELFYKSHNLFSSDLIAKRLIEITAIAKKFNVEFKVAKLKHVDFSNIARNELLGAKPEINTTYLPSSRPSQKNMRNLHTPKYRFDRSLKKKIFPFVERLQVMSNNTRQKRISFLYSVGIVRIKIEELWIGKSLLSTYFIFDVF